MQRNIVFERKRSGCILRKTERVMMTAMCGMMLIDKKNTNELMQMLKNGKNGSCKIEWTRFAKRGL